MTNIAIIGAGLAGLSAAHLLKDHGQITLFDKSRGVGGRMSTRRAEPYIFDHGAQYFTARTQPFQDFIQPLLDEGIIKRWDARYVQFDGNKIVQSKHWSQEEPRYIGVLGMNKIAKYLAQGLQVHLKTKIESMYFQDKWILTDEGGHEYGNFDWVICTAPAPQAALLLPKHFKYHSQIRNTPMNPCFALMLGLECKQTPKTSLPLAFDAAHVFNSDISWIAVNSHKLEQSEYFSLVVHSSAEYAQAHIHADTRQVMEHLIKQTSQIIGYDLGDGDQHIIPIIHRWLYADTVQDEKEKKDAKEEKIKTILLDTEHKLAVCGDWCAGGRVEGAFMSAYALACKMKENAL